MHGVAGERRALEPSSSCCTLGDSARERWIRRPRRACVSQVIACVLALEPGDRRSNTYDRLMRSFGGGAVPSDTAVAARSCSGSTPSESR